MSFLIQCPHCKCSLQLEDGVSNATFNCPQCSQLVTLANGMVQAPGMPAMNNAFAQQSMYKAPPRHLQSFPDGKRPWIKPSYKFMSSMFMTWWISGLAALFFGIISIIIWMLVDETAGLVLMLISLTPAVICFAAHLTLLYNYWKLIPPERARTTPDIAIGFLFLPVFQLYWNFVAYYELAKDMERELGFSTGAFAMSMAYCIATIASSVFFWVPILSPILGLVSLIFLVITIFIFQKNARILIARM